ncbi:MAG: cytochrome C [Gammaproteobacteria bacterium]|jgi:thiosulfate dehydrogenase
MNTTERHAIPLLISALLLAPLQTARADQFTKDDLERWKQEYMTVVGEGEKLFHGGLQSKNTVSCDQCHPDAANTHPETYPKFQQQLGRVAVLAEMVNWCIENPLESDPLAMDDPRMIAIQAYITEQRRKVPLAPGEH